MNCWAQSKTFEFSRGLKIARNKKSRRGKKRPNKRSGVPARQKFIGIYSRSYPVSGTRQRELLELEVIVDAERTSNQWWKIGEYKIYDGLLLEDDDLINEGIAALQSGSAHEAPSPTCMLDLGWILLHKNLDALAYDWLRRASDLVPDSADILRFLALSQLGCNKPEEAIYSLTKALQIDPKNSQAKESLEQLEAGVSE